MAIGLPAPDSVPSGLRDDLLKRSVTKGDALQVQAGGVVSFLMPLFMFPQYTLGLPSSLPMWWSYQRDAVLRSTILHEGFWGGALRIAATKAASQSFNIDGDVPSRNQRVQQIMLQWGGTGFVRSQTQGVQDYLTTDNGEFHEIVRTSGAAGSRIIGLVHLDSWRCQRTGDPEIPVLFRDLHGVLHELNYWDVIELSDMPSPSTAWWNIGHCAGADAYDNIYELSLLQTYVNEKLAGSGADKLSIVKGMTSKQIGSALQTAADAQKDKGLILYKGAALTGISGDETIDVKEVQLRGLPENFDIKQRMDAALLKYANSIGLDPQDLQPLSHQGLSGGTQSAVLFEKSKGRWPQRRNKELVQLLNTWVVPDSTTFAFSERDLTDELKGAQVKLARAQARGQQVTNGEINAEESRQLAVEADDLPRDFLQTTALIDEQLGDEDKPGAQPSDTLTPEQIAATPALATQTQPATASATQTTQQSAATIATNKPQSAGPASSFGDKIAAMLSKKERTRLRRKDIFELESNYRAELLDAVREVFSGDRSGFSLGTYMRSLVRNGAETMYLEGMVDSGEFDSTDEARKELTGDDEGAIADWIDSQAAEIPDFAQAAEKASKLRGDDAKSAQDVIINRVRLWADAFGGIGNSGKMSALANRMGVWVLGDTETHCTTKDGKTGCQQLAGKAHRLSWYQDNGYNPGSPGSETACGGMNCLCKIVDKKTKEVLIG